MKLTALHNNILSPVNRLNSSCVVFADFLTGSYSGGTYTVTDQGPNGNNISVTGLSGAPTITSGYCDFGAIQTEIVLPTFTVAADGCLVVAFGAKLITGTTNKVYGSGAGTVSLAVVNGASLLVSSTGNFLLSANNGFGTANDENMVVAFNNATFTTTSAPASYDETVTTTTTATGAAAAAALTTVKMDVRAISCLGIWNLATPPSDAALAAMVQWTDNQWAFAQNNRIPYPMLAEWT